MGDRGRFFVSSREETKNRPLSPISPRGRSDGLHGGKTDLVFFDFLHKSNEGIVVFMGENSCCMCILYFSEVVEFGRRILLTCL